MTLQWQQRRRLILAWLAAVIVTALIGTLIQTQLNLAALAALGVDIPLGVRVDTTLHDLIGFAPALAAIVGAGFLVAFPVASWLCRRRPSARRWLHILAAAAAIAVALIAMRLALGLTPVAAARSPHGFALLVASGALGGWVFARMRPQPQPR